MAKAQEWISLTACEIDPLKIPTGVIDNRSHIDNKSLPRLLVVTWLHPDIVSRVGLPQGSICGVLLDSNEPPAVERMVEKTEFLELIHSICARHIDPELVDFASRTTDDAIAVIDQRSPNVDAAIPTEDIIGTYATSHGTVDKYAPNQNYRLVTSRGCFQLTPWLRRCLAMRVIPSEEYPFD